LRNKELKEFMERIRNGNEDDRRELSGAHYSTADRVTRIAEKWTKRNGDFGLVNANWEP
jgi:hypothetical protein